MGALYRLVQTVRVHKENNELIEDCVTQFTDAVELLCLEDNQVAICVSGGLFFVQGERLAYRREDSHFIRRLLEFFEKCKLNGLRFHYSLTKAPRLELVTFANLLNRSVTQHDPSSWLSKQIEEARLGWLEVINEREMSHEELALERKQRAKKSYLYAFESVKEVAQKVGSGGQAGVRKARRMIQNMVDLAMEDEGVVLGLSTIKSHDNYTYVHSVNVAVLSVCLGKRIGLAHNSLEQLGVSGLFHDLGKVKVAPEILNKAQELNEAEWEEIREHPVTSVTQILGLRASHVMKSSILIAPFEHHLRYDLSGYPELKSRRSISLFGRVIAIADVYDALTSTRPYRLNPLSPSDALTVMSDRAGKDFDPILLKVFIKMMGRYPVGTILQFDNGELGLVTDTWEDSDKVGPKIVFLAPDSHGVLMPVRSLELGKGNAEGGTFKGNIFGAVHPQAYAINAARFLF